MACKWCIFCVYVFTELVYAHKNPNVWSNRSAIVHLFEWKFEDIALECERFLADHGFAAVQVSPVNENLVVMSDGYRPWWERYQPISYNITTRSGNKAQFKDMVRRCNQKGVRVYVDVVLNHMSGDMSNARGTAGSTADPVNKDYPAVPFDRQHFHTSCGIQDYQDANQVRNCELVGLHDLDQSSTYVRRKLVGFLDALVDCGVAGFRVDAVKHMSPSDLGPIYDAVKNLSSVNGFKDGTRPFFYQEVIDLGGEGISRYEYNQLGRITEFRFGAELSRAFRGQNAIKWLKNFGPTWGLLPSEDAVVFIDNHDTQRTSGNNILTYKDPKLYKMAVAFMLSWSYGFPRIMSSFAFQNSDTGPPHDEKQNILSVPIKEDETCGNDWVCEHRWRQIYNMVKFRNIVRGTSVKNWWDNRSKQIAFCRGNKGFIAFNDELNTVFRQHLQTCLPGGTYCDIISGSKLGDVCSGKSVVVDNLGEAEITIIATEQDGVFAIHAESKL